MNKRIRKKQLKKAKVYVDPKETWDLDISLAKYILPRLKAFKKNTTGYPCSLSSMDEWYGILDKMILTFTYITEGFIFESEPYENGLMEKVEEGLELFRQYYFNLWI